QPKTENPERLTRPAAILQTFLPSNNYVSIPLNSW
ncbi:MAG: hypothetical protein ACI9ZX_003339, partial [Algoriphagus sp.]